MSKWLVNSQKTLLKDNWINVRADSVLTHTGVLLDPYYVLSYPDWVHIIAYDNSNNCVLTRQYRYAAGIFSLELPCGAMINSDISPEAAAHRELLEETGFILVNPRLISSTYANPASHTNKVHVVVGTALPSDQPPNPEPGEELSVEIVPLSNLRHLCTSGAIVQSMHIASIFLALSDLSIS
jgi:8-oxo-dGTP pyrophosphatase MutT (NUDIX family)